MTSAPQGEWQYLADAHDDDVEQEMGTANNGLAWARAVGLLLLRSPDLPKLVPCTALP